MTSRDASTSDGRPGWWVRLLSTPLTDLCRGRITGGGNWHVQLADAELPETVKRAIASLLPSLPRRRRLPDCRRLIAWTGTQLSTGRDIEDVAECITSAGVAPNLAELTDLLERPLPAEVMQAARQFVARTGARGRRRRAFAAKLLAHLRTRIDEEQAPAAIAEAVAGSIALPALIGRIGDPANLLEAELPEPIVRLINDVVHRTRLWTNEQAEVARELAAHFQDGLSGGRSAEELIQSFGAANEAARLIRRSRLRCRPLAWHLWRRSWQVTGICGAVVIVVWGVLIVQFLRAQPNITFDPVAELDAAATAIPAEDRAWPLYREGLMRLSYADLASLTDSLPEAFLEGPAHPDWPAARAYLAKHHDSLELFLQAAERPELGFIHRESTEEQMAWLAWEGYESAANFNAPGTPAAGVLIPQVQELRRINWFFTAEMYASAERGEPDEVIRSLEASLQLAEHVQEDRLVISKLVAISFVENASRAISRIVDAQAALFDSAQLQRLQAALRGALDDDWSFALEPGARLLLNDFLQHAYSADGSFTAEGLRYLCGSESCLLEDRSDCPLPKVTEEADASLGNRVLFDALGSETVAWVAPRPEMEQKIDQLLSLSLAELEAGAEHGEKWSLQSELDTIRSSWSLRRRYWPLLPLFEQVVFPVKRVRSFMMTARHARLTRDATVVAIVLERYRRDYGGYPAALDDLVPQYLDAVPSDPVTGEALRYSLFEGAPRLADPDGEGVLLPAQFD